MLLVPTPGGLLVAPVEGGGGMCVVEPSLELEQLGELLHLRVSASDGEYTYTGFHGELDEAYSYGGPGYGGCEATRRTLTDLVVIPEQERLVLRLTQVAPRDQLRPLVEAVVEAEQVSLEGCGDILELSWTDGF